MENKEQIRIAESTLARQLEWIRAIETKLSLVVAISVGMLGLLAASIPDKPSCFEATAGVTALGGIGSVLTIIFCGFATFPRTKSNNNSLLFFGTIADRSEATFIHDFKSSDTQTYLNDLLHQTYQNALIANKKHTYVKHAIITLIASIPLWLTSIYILGSI